MKFDVWIEVDLLPLYSTRTAESTQIQKSLKSAVPNWFIRRTLHDPDLIIRFGTVRCSMCVNDWFQFCLVAVHTIPDSFSCQHEQLSGMWARFKRRTLQVPNLIIRFDTCKVRRYITHSWRELGRPVHQLTDSSTPYAFSCANNKLRKMESNAFDKSMAIKTSFLFATREI